MQDRTRNPLDSDSATPASGVDAGELAAYGLGVMSEAEAQAFKLKLEHSPEMKKAYAELEPVFELMRKNRCEAPLDYQKIRDQLRERIQGELRRSPNSEHLPIQRKRRVYWLTAVTSAAAVACVLFAILGGPRSLQLRPDPSVRQAIAATESNAEEPRREIYAGDNLKASKEGMNITFLKGTEVSLEPRTVASVTGAEQLDLKQGAAAVHVSEQAAGFSVTFRTATGVSQLKGLPGSRILVRVNEDAAGQTSEERERILANLAVAQGQAEFQDFNRNLLALGSGQAINCDLYGRSSPVRAANLQKHFAWVFQGSIENLNFTLKLEPGETNIRAILQLKNSGTRALVLASYHPLAANYQMEILRPGASSPDFVKLSPSKLRRIAQDGVQVTLEPSTAPLTLQPEECYELEIELSQHLIAEGKYSLKAHYMGFAQAQSGDRKISAWGTMKRSNTVEYLQGAVKSSSKRILWMKSQIELKSEGASGEPSKEP